MTLKLEGDIDILKMYLHNENRLRNSKLLIEDDMCMENAKNMKIALEVKGQGQMSPTSNHF